MSPATVTPFPLRADAEATCSQCSHPARPGPCVCQACLDLRDARLAAAAVRDAHADVQEIHVHEDLPVLRGLPLNIAERPTARIEWDTSAAGGWTLAKDQGGTLLEILTQHASQAVERRDDVASHCVRLADGTWSEWRDGAPPADVAADQFKAAYAMRALPFGPARTHDPMQPARWIEVLDGLIRGPLALYLMEGGVGLELARLRSWLERESDPGLRALLFEDGAFTGPTKLPLAQLSQVMNEPTDYARGYDAGWNAYRLLVAHQAPDEPLPPDRVAVEGRGNQWAAGYDAGWNACYHAANRACG